MQQPLSALLPLPACPACIPLNPPPHHPASPLPPALLPRPAAKQEQTKAWLHILLDIAVMVCVMLSDPSLPHSPAPLPTLIVTSFLTVLDMVRLRLRAGLWALPCACLWHCKSLAGVAALCGYELSGAMIALPSTTQSKAQSRAWE